MVRRIAVYGKGGIGKSTVSSNVTAALSLQGTKVLQIGCDPKHDSTRSLLGAEQSTVLDYIRGTPPGDRRLSDIMHEGYAGCYCVEAGGPEPGVGCAGRGIISAIGLLDELGQDTVDRDIVIYDVLGDVVCGGFAVPLRKGYADTVFIVTSGEFMSLYAANNILRGTANYGADRIGGIIFNSRGDEAEEERVERFSQAVGIPIVVRIPRSDLFMEAEVAAKTVMEMFPESDVSDRFRELAQLIMSGRRYTAKYLSEHDLEMVVLGAGRPVAESTAHQDIDNAPRKVPYVARRAHYGDPLGGCAFSGAISVSTSIGDMFTILHSPLSCAHYAMQLQGMCALRKKLPGGFGIPGYADPHVMCTRMAADDMVFGGNEILSKAIDEAVAQGAKAVSVVTQCPPGIIGDDTATICRAAEAKHPGTDIILMEEDGNAKGDFMQGVVDGCVTLVRKLAVRGGKKPMTVNIVGVKTLASGTPQEVRKVTELLQGIGVSVNCVFPASGSVESIRHITDASANLLINGDAFSCNLARFLSDEYGMERIEVPVRGGLEGTQTWLRCVQEYFGVPERAEEVLSSIRSEFSDALSTAKKVLSGKRFVFLSTTRDIGWQVEALREQGVDIEKVFVYHRPDHSNELDVEVPDSDYDMVLYSDGSWVQKEINKLHPDVLLASYPMGGVDPGIRQMPISVSAKADPMDGVDLVYAITRGILAPQKEGWREDVARIQHP